MQWLTRTEAYPGELRGRAQPELARRTIKKDRKRYWPKVNGPMMQPPVSTTKSSLALVLHKSLDPDTLRNVVEQVQAANDALPPEVRDEVHKIIKHAGHSFEKMKSVEDDVITRAMNNVRNLATSSPDYPALNGVAAYLYTSPMEDSVTGVTDVDSWK